MAEVNDKIVYLEETKQQIAEAIQGKGVTIPDDATFRDYASIIEEQIVVGEILDDAEEMDF